MGATLWLAPREVSSDPEALPLALIAAADHRRYAALILLALVCRDIPSLRLINLGGEAGPEALVARWARPGRQIFNTHGLRSHRFGQLGRNHRRFTGNHRQTASNYGLLVIDPTIENGLCLLPRGETGELCVTGPGVAAGDPRLAPT